MRRQFAGYFKLDQSRIDSAWTDGFIAFDTNALLNLYRFDVDTRNLLLSAVRALAGRAWLPAQVAFEFHRNRVGVIRGQQKSVDAVSRTLADLKGRMTGQLGSLRRNPVLNVDRLTQLLSESFKECDAIVEEARQSFGATYGITPQEDSILLAIAEVFADSVGAPYTAEHQITIEAEAKRRYELEIPPGYKDQNKSNGNPYGDFVLWRQLLDEAKARDVPLILVTDEEKEDWWWESEGQTLGPRPELRQEFLDTVGHEILLYRSPAFLRGAGERKLITVESDAVRNAEDVLSREERARDESFLERSLARQRRLVDSIKAVEAEHFVAADYARTLKRATYTPSDIDGVRDRYREIERLQAEQIRRLLRSKDPHERAEIESELARLEKRRGPFELILGASVDGSESESDPALLVRAAEQRADLLHERGSSLKDALRKEVNAYQAMHDAGTPLADPT